MYIIVEKDYIEDHYETYDVLGNHPDEAGAIAMVDEVEIRGEWIAVFQVPEFGFFKVDYDLKNAIYSKIPKKESVYSKIFGSKNT